MGVVLSHRSALEYLRFASVELPLHSICVEDMRRAPRKSVAGKRVLNASRPSAALVAEMKRCGFGYLSDPVHLLVADRDNRCRARNVCCHSCTGLLPSGFLIEAGEGVFATSPELTFVSLAAELPFVEAVLIGYELCGTYSREVGGSAGRQVRRDPLTSVSDIRTFVDKVDARCGVKRARAALSFVGNGSASYMETSLLLILCLPKRLGGYGLPMPLMNSKVGFLRTARAAAEGDYCVCDLIWPSAALAVEYDSNLCHTGKTSIAHDANRRVILSHRGIETVTVTWGQVRDREKLDQVARLIAERLGVRLRTNGSGWHGANLALRARLLG